MRDSIFLKPEMIGRQSHIRRSLEGKTKTHTRAMYTDLSYRKAIVYAHGTIANWENDEEKFRSFLKTATKSYKHLYCPCCIDLLGLAQKDDTITLNGLYGNLRHYRFYCLNEDVKAIRNKMTNLLEDHLAALFRIASNWGAQGFSTLLNRAITALTMLD
jgi:hypothetical protein